MMPLLPLIPAFPLAGFALLALGGGRLTPRHIAWIGTGSVAASALVALLITPEFLAGLPQTAHYRQSLWTWVDTAGFTAGVTWYLDALSLLMTLVITGVGFLIHLYSVEYMAGDEGYRRFFAYMNLFIASMLTLVLADDLLLLYLGWEGVGLCSYLLIGFWYQDAGNGAAAQKAFLVTRAGDTAFAIALFLLFATLGTLSIQQVQILAGIDGCRHPGGQVDLPLAGSREGRQLDGLVVRVEKDVPMRGNEARANPVIGGQILGVKFAEGGGASGPGKHVERRVQHPTAHLVHEVCQ